MKSQRYTIPKHAHAKAIAHFKRVNQCKTYPLREINGVHGGEIRTTDKNKTVRGLMVSFVRYESGHCSGLRFERVV